MTCDADTLLRQAPMTAQDYLSKAVRNIDACLGEGFALEHPDLITAFIQTCAIDFHAGIINNLSDILYQAINACAESQTKIADDISVELSAMTQALDDLGHNGMADALQNIAVVLDTQLPKLEFRHD